MVWWYAVSPISMSGGRAGCSLGAKVMHATIRYVVQLRELQTMVVMCGDELGGRRE